MLFFIQQAEDLERGQILEENCLKGKARRRTNTGNFQRIVIMFLLLGVIGAIAGVVWYFLGWMSLVQLVLVAIVAFIASGRRYRWFYVAACTAKRDLT